MSPFGIMRLNKGLNILIVHFLYNLTVKRGKMPLKILSDKYKEYKEIIDMYNQVSEEQIDWEKIIDEALQNLLTNPETDWSWLRHYNYYPTKDNPRPWEPVYYKPDSEKLKPYIKDKIVEDDIINFALKFNKPNLVKYKKAIIDAIWNTDRLLCVLDKYKMTQNLKYGEDYITIDCPACGHESMKIWINEDDSVIVSCYSTKCILNRTNIWKLFEITDHTMFTAVETVWDIIQHMDANEIKKIRALEGIKLKKSYYNKNLEKIIADCTTENKYMNSCGFSDELLKECEILYRDERENPTCSESNDFRNRVCYIIRDIEGKIVGIQGRSIIDTDWKRNNYVLDDDFWKTQYWDNRWTKKIRTKMDKLTEKVINTAGFGKSEHLYLLHKYVNKTNNITTVVVVEGLKDAIRVYQQKFNYIAVVSIMGAEISLKQAKLLQTIFGLDKQILLALDGDDAGYHGSTKAYDTLKNCGFKNIRFVLYPRISEYGFYYKDFGDITSPKLILETIKASVDIETYKIQMETRLPLIRVAKILKEKAERQEYWETIKDDFIPVSKEDLPLQVKELFNIK